MPANLGAAARKVGVAFSASPYVAFSDDDSWWAPGALVRAASVLEANPRMAVVCGRILVGAEQRIDPVCDAMAASPNLLGFIACGAVVRRSAFLQCGGFDSRYGVGGEEELLALDLAAAGWHLCYRDDVVAHHFPAGRDSADRTQRQTRNSLWTAWLRRRALGSLAATVRVVAESRGDPVAIRGVAEAASGIPWVWYERRPVPRSLERRIRRLTRRHVG
jgi:N-acetylglucosaminyl-diphospho-decaprenol L-rhamnosyltransferase